MEKVKVSKEEAEAIREALEDYNPVEIISLHVQRNLARLNAMDRDTLIKALYIGYEVEMSIEEKLLEAYKRGIVKLDTSAQDVATGCFQLGMQNTLSIIGMKVKGINDDWSET